MKNFLLCKCPSLLKNWECLNCCSDDDARTQFNRRLLVYIRFLFSFFIFWDSNIYEAEMLAETLTTTKLEKVDSWIDRNLLFTCLTLSLSLQNYLFIYLFFYLAQNHLRKLLQGFWNKNCSLDLLILYVLMYSKPHGYFKYSVITWIKHH